MNNYKGFSTLGMVILLVTVSLIGGIGWYVWQSNNNESKNSSAIIENTEQSEVTGIRTSEDGVVYSVIPEWKNTTGPFESDSAEQTGNYLLSPDYKTADEGQLSIATGAFINFQKVGWIGIEADTTLEDALKVVKNTDGYFDPNTAKIDTVGDKQVIMFDSGHTTNGVTILYKTTDQRWLDLSFSATAGDDGYYDPRTSAHYPTYLSWVEEITKLNP